VGEDVRLTIHLPAQVAADLALGDQEGAVVVIEVETGAVLVMSSHPTYNPNTLDDMWETLRDDERAPLLNRATQGLFPVGDLARLVGLIGLSEAGAAIPADPLSAPLESLLAPLSPAGYLATAHQLKLTEPLEAIRSQPGRLPDFEAEETVRDLAVTPIHLARVGAALALDGYMPKPILSLTSDQKQTRLFGPDTARYVRAILPQVDGTTVGLTGQASPEETGQAWLSWFVGLAPADVQKRPASAEMLPLDPALAPPAPTPSAPGQSSRPARYVVVAVVVTDQLATDQAFRIARAPLRVILE
jgi:hypothetical protein